ncbi:OmpH family outer membrane protein [Spiribacter sp. 2438]|uniref:OmpH family outer membrane protein n=1 Tax=Spiribacter sp. 2438 TaxID=2666185 RepID=UPI001E360D5C|nr:OmpH family outer membrane protein [Spiribacter sp. 2438]
MMIARTLIAGGGPARWVAGLIAAGLALGLSLPTTVLATEERDSITIGYVNPGRVSDEAPQADAARERLQEEFAPRDEAIVEMQDELRRLEDRLAEQRLTLDQDIQQELQREIVTRRRQIQRQQDAFREDFNMRRNESLGQLQRRILRTVEEFAEENNFDLVVSDGVVFASDAINITDRIIERLRLQYEQQQDNGG